MKRHDNDDNTPVPPSLFDPEDYRDDLKAFDLSPTQEDELLHALWRIMCAFVELGWGVDSVNFCIPASSEFSSAAAPAMVDSKGDHTTIETNEAAQAELLEVGDS